MKPASQLSRKIVKTVIVFDSTTGEWIVEAYDQFNSHYEEADYLTDDRQDAIATSKKMSASQ